MIKILRRFQWILTTLSTVEVSFDHVHVIYSTVDDLLAKFAYDWFINNDLNWACARKWVYLGVKTCFVAIVWARVYYVDLRHCVTGECYKSFLTLRMSAKSLHRRRSKTDMRRTVKSFLYVT